VEKTIEYVNPTASTWENPEGKTFYFVEATFDDGATGSVFCFSQSNADETIAALKELVGHPADLTLEKGKEYNGKQQWKIKGFPGKPSSGGGGGSRSGGGGMSHSQAGMIAAGSAVNVTLEDDIQLAAALIIELSELLTEHLFSRRKTDETETTETAAPTVPADSITLPQMAKIKALGASRDLATPEAIAKALGIAKLGDLSTEDADTLIASWSA